MKEAVSETKHKWTGEEAHSSGKTAFLIGVERSGNPFLSDPFLGELWDEAWLEAQSKAPVQPRRERHSEDNHYERRPNTRNRFRNSVR